MTSVIVPNRWWQAFILLLVSVTAALLLLTGATQSVGCFLFDQFSRSLPRSSTDDVVLIVIDEQSIDEIGRWPWSRGVHAQLVDKLTDANVRAIGINLLFSEPETADLSADSQLAAALQRNGRTVLPLVNESTNSTDTLRTAQPIPELAKAAFGLGHTGVGLSNGVVRYLYLQSGIGSATWPAFSAALLSAAGEQLPSPLPGARNKSEQSAGSANWVRDYETLIPFSIAAEQFRRYSYIDVLAGRTATDVFADRIVLIGVTAAGIADRFSTPVLNDSRQTSGVELQAQLLHTLKNRQLVTPASKWVMLALTITIVILPLIFFRHTSYPGSLGLTVGTAALALICSASTVHLAQFWIDPSAAVLLLLLGHPLLLSQNVGNAIQQLFYERQHGEMVLNAIGDAVLTLTPDRRIEYMNASAEAMSGLSSDDCRGQLFNDIFSTASDDGINPLDAAIDECTKTVTLIRCRQPMPIKNPQGTHYTITASIGPTINKRKQLQNIVVGITDVTENIKASKQLAFQATHDALTNLPNRNLLLDRLELAIKRAARSKHMIAVLFIDLDQFKNINDGLGHTIGDKLLQHVAQNLRRCARQGDTIARLGGDEFVVLLEDLTDPGVAASVAYKILELAKMPYIIDEQNLFISTSIGISVFPKDGDTAVDLLKHADTAMYQVKSSGRNDLSYFSAEMNKVTLRRLEIEKNLHTALRQKEFTLHYQPQFSIQTGQITGVEALIRWPHKAGLRHSPNEFIPVAEDTGLIFSIGDWVLRTACEQLMQWNEQGLQPRRLSVNISPRQMLHGQFAQVIINALHDSGLPAPYLELEITEYSIMTDLHHAASILQAFKAIGCSIAVDDFGTGYSSLNYLKYLPIDTLKIDQSFVADIVEREEDRAITQAIITMARGLNMMVIAEGVETKSQLEVLRDQYCDEYQGHLRSTPLSAADMTEFLRNYDVNSS